MYHNLLKLGEKLSQFTFFKHNLSYFTRLCLVGLLVILSTLTDGYNNNTEALAGYVW